jgi:hypothetical protein
MRPFKKAEVAGIDEVTVIVSYLSSPAPACAAWIDRKFKGDGILLDRENWRAGRWRTDELGALRKSGELPIWVSEAAKAVRAGRPLHRDHGEGLPGG